MTIARPRVLTSVALFALATVGTVHQAQAGCADDTECKSGRVCRAGECVEPPAAASCGTDTDCPGDLICAQGVCAATAPAGAALSEQEGAAPTQSAPPLGAPAPAPALPPGTGGLRIVSTVPGTVYVDGGQVGIVGAQPFELPGISPGRHKVMVETAGGTEATERATVAVGQFVDVRVDPSEDYNNYGLMVAGAVLLPVGFVTAGVGVIWAAAKPNRVEGHPESYIPLWGIGGAAVVTGIVMLAVGAPRVTTEEASGAPAGTVSVVPLLGPTGGGVIVTF